MMGKSAIFNARHGAGSFHRYAAFPFQRFGLYRGVVTEVTRAPVRTGDEIRAPSRRRSQRMGFIGSWSILNLPMWRRMASEGLSKQA